MKIKIYTVLLIFVKLCNPVFGQSSNMFNDFLLPKLIPFEQNGKYGYCNTNKEIIINIKFDDAYPFNEDMEVQNSSNENLRKYGSENFATVIIKKEKYRIDSAGKIVYTFNGDYIDYNMALEKEIFFIYEDGNSKGIKDNDSIIIKAKYEEIYPITYLKQCKPFIAKLNGKYGIVDVDRVLLDFKYDNISYPFDYPTSWCPLVIAEINKRKFYVDFNGNEYR